MKSLRVLFIASLLMLIGVGLASAQEPAYTTPFVTSVTYQNISNANAEVIFNFYAEGSSTATEVPVTLNANAGASLFIGGVNQLPDNFSGSAVVSSNQPIVATLVQIPQSDTVKNRPLSNGFSTTSSQVLIATVLKNKFNSTSKFSVQNADSGAVELTVTFYNADNPAAAPIVLPVANIPAGSAKFYDAGQIAELPNPFNGSAIITAVRAGTQTAANIVASALELSTNGAAASAFEGVPSGAKTVYMPSALCDAFGGIQNSFYAVQNTSTTQATNVTVTYSSGEVDTANIPAGQKKSFITCNVNNPNFSGSATITSDTTDIVVIGKVAGGGISSAFLGEANGSARLALPYVRYTNDASYTGGGQRGFIAIQNVGNDTVNNVSVQYLNKNGEVVGTHIIASIAAGQKANSTAVSATPASGHSAAELQEFGLPAANPGGGFGGSVIVEAAGAELVAVVRVASGFNGGLVAEDYNGIAIQ